MGAPPKPPSRASKREASWVAQRSMARPCCAAVSASGEGCRQAGGGGAGAGEQRPSSGATRPIHAHGAAWAALDAVLHCAAALATAAPCRACCAVLCLLCCAPPHLGRHRLRQLGHGGLGGPPHLLLLLSPHLGGISGIDGAGIGAAGPRTERQSAPGGPAAAPTPQTPPPSHLGDAAQHRLEPGAAIGILGREICAWHKGE